ncbi:MAG: CxxxxCH/CxxCH domain-containing protein, partial [Candidatus Zixiibacteriota bacterium]
ELPGGQSVWDRGTASCSGIYCHGNFPGGKIANAPVWTSSDQAGCGSCHDVGDDPASLGGKHWKHVQIKDLLCSRCHSSTVDSTLNIIGTSVHLDGQNQVSFSTGQGSYDNWTCSSLENECHRPRSWYKGR